MAARTTITGTFAERASAVLSLTLTSEDGVTGFKPTTTTLTLYNAENGEIINSRAAFDIAASVAVDGTLTLALAPDDMVIQSPRAGKATEVHVALIEWAWSSGTKAGRHEIAFTVGDLAKVP